MRANIAILKSILLNALILVRDSGLATHFMQTQRENTGFNAQLKCGAKHIFT